MGSLPYHMIKLNVDVSLVHNKASMLALAWKYDKELLGLWYDKLECSLALAVELLATPKAYLVSNNFLSREIQIENDCKVPMEALLSISLCPRRAILIFQNVKNLLIALEKVDVVCCLKNCNENVHETMKWVESAKVKMGFYSMYP